MSYNEPRRFFVCIKNGYYFNNNHIDVKEVMGVCLDGVYKEVDVIHAQNNKRVKIDACIADEIKQLNTDGIVTMGSCCGHGRAGHIVEWKNDYGKWKSHEGPPIALIEQNSVARAKEFGYRPFPYHYADGENNGVWQMYLKTGCMTFEDVTEWHVQNHVPFEKHFGVIKEEREKSFFSLAE